MAIQALVTGATGQIGTELLQALRARHGAHAVVATGLEPPPGERSSWEPYETLDVTDADAVLAAFERHRPATLYHLAAMLSAVGERKPRAAWHVNFDGLWTVLEAAQKTGVRQVFWPSSMAVFGPDVARDPAPQDGSLRPTTIYGMAKVAGELLCEYFTRNFGLDIRGIRYPGVISSEQFPGGGTTDYAVEMFYAAVRGEPYTGFVRADTVLPMIYMPDCIAAALDLMNADVTRLTHRNRYNIAAMSFSAGELAEAIGRRVPGFECRFEPDRRQQIADSWPRTLDDRPARDDWGWCPKFGLEAMIDDMLARLRARWVAGTL